MTIKNIFHHILITVMQKYFINILNISIYKFMIAFVILPVIYAGFNLNMICIMYCFTLQ